MHLFQKFLKIIFSACDLAGKGGKVRGMGRDWQAAEGIPGFALDSTIIDIFHLNV